MEEPDAPEEPAAPDPAPEEPAPAEEAPEEEPAQPDAAPEIAEPPVDVDGGGGLGDGLAKSVGLAFTGPTQNMQSVFKLVFDVVQKQQVVISTLREEVNDMRDEYPRRLSALENEVAELKVALADATALGSAPAPAAAPEPPPKYSVFVGNLPLDVDTHDTQSLLDDKTFDDATHASVDPPMSCDKWSSAHQVNVHAEEALLLRRRRLHTARRVLSGLPGRCC